MSSPSGVRGGAPADIAFFAYFRPRNASGSKKMRFSSPKYKEKVVVTVTIVTYKVAPMYGPVFACVCLSVTSGCSIEKAERIELVFGRGASFDLSYTVL